LQKVTTEKQIIQDKRPEPIRTLRKKKGWSQEKLALETNLHRAYIGQIERGEKNIGLQNLQIIAKTLATTISELVKNAD